MVSLATRIDIKIDQAGLYAQLDGPVKADLMDRSRRVRRAIAGDAPVGQTRRLSKVSSYDIDISGSRGQWDSVIRPNANAPHADYVIFGTGIHNRTGLGQFSGGRGRIRPRSKKALAWTSPDGTRVIRKSVAGQKANNYMRRGIRAAV